MRSPLPRILSVGLAVMLVSCRDDVRDPWGPGPTGEPLYLVATTVFTDDDSFTYFASVSSLDAAQTIDLAAAIERPGMAKLYARDGVGWFALGGGEAPTITRFDLNDAGVLVEGPTLTFQPQGTDFLGDTVVFVSPTKAYYFDAPNRQLIVWNPAEMAITGTIDLAMTAGEDGMTTIYDVEPLLRDDGTLLFPVAWRNFATDETYPGTGLVVIDTDTDTVQRYTVSDRCQGITWSATLENGDLYAATTPYYAVLQHVTGEGPAPCVLRVRDGEDEFDADYDFSLETLVEGRVAGGLARGPDGTLYFRAVEPGVTVTPETDVAGLWSDAVWRWYRWDLDANTATAITSLPTSAAGGLTYDVDGKVYAIDAAADWSSSNLIEMTADGDPAPAIQATGYIYGVARVR